MLQQVVDYAPKFFRGPSYKVVKDLIRSEVFEGREIYPHDPLRAFKEVAFDDVKVVILGQDPYHNGTADGLAFSSYPHNPINRSLKRVFREYCDNLSYPMPRTGDLTDWARRGVLLLNTSLTVEKGRAGSHSEIGWHYLAREVLYRLAKKREGLVFMLWGAHARRQRMCIEDHEHKHLVLQHCHPSPLSGSEWFKDNNCFSKSLDYMQEEREFWKLR